MRKVTQYPLVLIGKLDNRYEFAVYDFNSELCSAGGIYIYICLKNNDFFVSNPELIYCGQTNDLQRRHSEHCSDDEDMVGDSNCICFRQEERENERTRIERDILGANDFQYNEQLN